MTKPKTMNWQDGDTMLSFGAFALIVALLLVWRLSDPANWLVLTNSASEINVAATLDCAQSLSDRW